MIFLITKVNSPVQGKDPTVIWSLHRQEDGKPGEVMCRSVESWPTERQTRANINTFKRACSGTSLRFSKVQLKEITPQPEKQP